MADWRPLVTDPDRRAELIRVIGESVELPEPTEMSLLLDRAVTRAYLAQDDIVPDPDDVTVHSLGAAVTAFAAAPRAAGLFGGAAGLGWTLEHLVGGEDSEPVCASIDQALLHRLDTWADDYDLISGLVGLGVYALERGEAAALVIARVLALLERTAQPHDGGVAWHTPAELLPRWQRELNPEGYWNYGLSHGLPGVVGLLARCVKLDVEAARARALLDGAMTALLAIDHANGYPAWLPARRSGNSRRVAWCYGDLGVAISVLAAARSCDRDDWRARGLAIAHRCTGHDATIEDAGICHGTAGAAHLLNRIANATGDDMFADAARRWIDQTLAFGRTHGGFPSKSPTDADAFIADASVLTGAPGVALVLHAAISEVEPTWDRLILADCC